MAIPPLPVCLNVHFFSTAYTTPPSTSYKALCSMDADASLDDLDILLGDSLLTPCVQDVRPFQAVADVDDQMNVKTYSASVPDAVGEKFVYSCVSTS